VDLASPLEAKIEDLVKALYLVTKPKYKETKETIKNSPLDRKEKRYKALYLVHSRGDNKYFQNVWRAE
jgi:hypothetical protein